MEQKEKPLVTLDNDALTRLIYLHDDEITELISYIRQLEERVRELENKNTQQKSNTEGVIEV